MLLVPAGETVLSVDFAHLAPGFEVAGRYRIERAIKAGGMGAVYVAVHNATKRRCALKLMHPSIVRDADMRRRFAQEAQVSALVRSKHLVDVFDAGVDDAAGGAPFLVMELLEGHELGEWIREHGALAPQVARIYLEHVAEGLAKAHVAGVVHRDLKPENLFVTREESGAPLVKILDFGIAKVMEGALSAPTQSGGTPLYMAPEQMGRDAISPAADIWAFGLVAYTLLVGRPFWAAESIGELYGEILKGGYPSAVERAASQGVALPASFDGFFARCVAREPKDRFATATLAVAALRDALQGAAPSTSSPVASAPRSAPTSAPAIVVRSDSVQPVSGDAATVPVSALDLASSTGSSAMSAAVTRPAEPAPAARAATAAPVAKGPWTQRWGVALAALAAAGLLLGGFAFALRAMRARTLARVTSSLERPGAQSAAHPRDAGARVSASAKPRHVVRIAAGEDHSCALFDDGTASCWGLAAARAGSGMNLEARARPKALFGVEHASFLAAGGYSTCAVEAGKPRCFGPLAQTAARPSPSDLADVDLVGVGYGANLCAVRRDGRVDCSGDFDVPRDDDHAIAGMHDAKAVAVGYEHACVLGASGEVTCFGANGDRQLGDGTDRPSPGLHVVDGVTDVVELAAGHSHTCARRGDGSVVCWGDPTLGALGRPSTDGRAALVPGIEHVKAVAAGLHATCVIEHDGGVRCWGDMHGRAPEAHDASSSAGRASPAGFRVPGLSDVVELVMGPRHACARLRAGRVACWGDDEAGQLGFVAADACDHQVPCAHEPIVVSGL